MICIITLTVTYTGSLYGNKDIFYILYVWSSFSFFFSIYLQDQPCHYNSSGIAADCKGFKEIPEGDERALAVALFKVGPVSVGIDATQSTFQFYQRGR